MSVVIWCDLGPGIGVGHLMRCVALAEELRSRGGEVRFLADATAVPFAREQLERRRLPWEPPPSDPLAGVDLVARRRPDAVVVDSYLLPPEVYAALRASHRLLAFVDTGVGDREADVYLDHTLGAEDPGPAALPVPGAVRLFGIGFALVRDDVLRHRPKDPGDHADGVPPRVVVFSGGTDASAAAPAMLRTLVGTGEPFAATAVAATEERAARLRAVVPGAGQEVTVVRPTARLPALVARADLVLSAAGTSSSELLCLGAAAALVQVADNQADTYARMVGSGLVAPLGRVEELRADPGRAAPAVRRLLRDADERVRLRRAGWELVDGRGRGRVADRLAPGRLAPDRLDPGRLAPGRLDPGASGG